jgi:3-oxoacyl-[acyl-carrier protein] reductase
VTGQSVLITGAAGGIGRATALELARRGYAIAVADLDQDSCDAFAAELRAEGATAIGVALDVTSTESAEAAVAAAAGLGEFVALVNCAGIVHLGEILDVSPEDWERIIGVNLTGTFNLCRAAVPELSKRGACIVNLTSTAGRTSSTYSSPAYVASKAGVVGLTMSLARQLAPANIRVNAVAPGIIDTAMIDLYGEERKARLVAGIPLGRMGTTAEVATTVAYLATPESSYVTGQTIAINGGTFIS